MVSAAYDVSRQFNQAWARAMDRRLTSFLTNATSEAGKVLANVTMPWDGAVGDHIGLYPIAFLSRAQYYNLSTTSPEWTVAVRTADKYVLGWPMRVPDGSGAFSRAAGWSGQPPGTSFMWCDDTFMVRSSRTGARAAATLPDASERSGNPPSPRFPAPPSTRPCRAWRS